MMRVKRPFDNRNFKIRTVKRLALVSALVAFSIGPPGVCAAQGPDLDVLENKFFHHTYPKDTSEARIDRLEKMVFGEAKDGPERDRIDGLMKMVDEADDDQPVAERGTTGGGGSQAPANRGASSSGSSTAKKSAPAQAPEKVAREDYGTSYPAVSAIEKKVFGKDFSDEAVEDRLTRLEKKTFGQISKSNDLSERMDALKEKTGIDIARSSPQGADWNEEEDDSAGYPEPSSPVARSYPGVSPRDSGRSFSGRDVGDDLNRAFGRRPGGGTGSGGSGSYGMGGGSQVFSGGSGAYGFGGGSRGSGSGLNYSRGAGSGSTSSFGGKSSAGIIGSSDDDNDGLPPAAPSIARRSPGAPLIASRPGVGEPPVAPPRGTAQGGGGLTVQLDALEGQVFGKSYSQEGLIQRLERLETTVFPGDRSAKSRTPAERIARLAGVVPIGINPTQNISRNQPMDQDGDGSPDYDNSQIAQQQQLPQAQRSRGGLGKIINSLGNFLGGGMSVGSYGMPTGNLVTDPQTGMLVDQYSGNLINPSTGQVVGRKAGFGYQSPIPNYGVNFNNGFSSPYTNPMYSNPAYGIGGSGLRFGSGMGGIGGVRFGGGMWP
ncbi:MAG: hypothetical protein K2X93_16765 [Candidatus Obscuribacterales bacterium]|nr:hypothetical protein [Candidatus Obscuribacterales bacterium]